MKQYPVSTLTICAIVVFAFSAGAVAAAALVGKYSTTGNAADWLAALAGGVAALGAWAIGIGANEYARIAHQLRTDEVEDARKEASHKRRAIKRHLALRAKTMRVPADGYDEFLKDPEMTEHPILRLVGMTKANLDSIDLIVWNDEHRLLLSDKGASALLSLEFNTRYLIAMSRDFIDGHRQNEGAFDAVRTPHFPHLYESATVLRASADELLKHIAEIPDK